MTQPTYIDFSINPNTQVDIPLIPGHTAFLYIFEGTTHVGTDQHGKHYGSGKVLLLDSFGDTVRLGTNAQSARLILVSGKPLNEPVAWHGPVVMNTQEELVQAFSELEAGTFIK